MWKRWKHGISIATRTSAAEWMLAIDIVRLLVVFRVALMQRSFPDVLAAATRRAYRTGKSVSPRFIRSPRPDEYEYTGGDERFEPVRAHAPVPDIGIWVERISRVLPGTYTCLTKALAGYVLYTRAGFIPAIRVGATVEQGNRLLAHAWLEVDGIVTIGNGPDLSHYSVFERRGGLLP